MVLTTYPKLRRAVMALDEALTDGQFVRHNAHQRFAEIEEPLDVYLAFISEYYLSDDGYSRIFWDVDLHRLLLTSSSTVTVKERWHDADDLRKALEAEIWDILGPYLQEE